MLVADIYKEEINKIFTEIVIIDCLNGYPIKPDLKTSTYIDLANEAFELVKDAPVEDLEKILFNFRDKKMADVEKYIAARKAEKPNDKKTNYKLEYGISLEAAIRHTLDRYSVYQGRKKENPQVIENYNKFLDKLVELALSLGLKNPLEYSIFFTICLWEGNLATNKTHQFSQEYSDIVETLTGKDSIAQDDKYMAALHIFNGEGVCFNNANALTDFLNRFDQKQNISAAVLLNHFDDDITDEEKQARHFKIQQIEEKGPSSKLSKYVIGLVKLLKISLRKKVPNHAHVLIQDNGKWFIFDPTNLMYFNLESKTKASSIETPDYKNLFMVLQSLDYSFDSKSTETLKKFISETPINAPYTAEEYRQSVDRVTKIMNDNKEKIDEFIDSTQDIKQYITDDLKYR